MPDFARINQTDVTADYANTVLWEAGEESSNYGSVTTGIQEDLYSPTGGLRIDGAWPNSFQLIAKAGEEANASDITQGAGFVAGSGQFIDIRVPNGEFKNIRLDGTFLRITGTSTNTKLTNCVSKGTIGQNIANDLVLENTLFMSDGVAETIAIRDTPATLNKSTVISLNDTGGHVIRSRGSAVVDSNDSVCFAPNTATSFLAFIGGTFTGDYNAGHTGGSTPGANSITNLTRTLTDVFTNPAGNDYTPKLGGPLDGASSTSGFIGAFAPTASGISIAVDSGIYSYVGTDAQLLTTRILKADTGAYLYTGSAVSLLKGFVLTANAGSYSYLGQDATLTYTPAGAFILTADSGGYAYTGSNINFNRDRVIIASSGTYNYNGTDIQIILPGQIWTDKPSVSTNWNNQTATTTIWTDK
tara:strand:+ start:3937 stop:5181 length:1245 start_codon:yes stop_codon:yes gene_type:complete